MKKIIISVALVLFVGTSYASLTPVQNDIENIKQAVPAGTPSVGGSYEQKGFVGHLLGEIFELSGHIKNQFIVAFQDIDGIFSNTVPKWDGQKFVEGSITDRNGNVGIGTNSPQTDLDIAGNNNGFARINGGDGAMSLRNNGTSNIWKINAAGGSGETKFIIHDDGSSRLTIDTLGRVGVGTILPTQRLDVNGKIRMRSHTSNSDPSHTVTTKGYVDNKVSSSSRELLRGWPDAIRCSGSGRTWVFHIQEWSSSWVRYGDSSDSDDRSISFNRNRNKTYRNAHDDPEYYSSCVGRNIQQIINAGRAYKIGFQRMR